MVDDIITCVIYTPAIRTRLQSLRHVLDIQHIRIDDMSSPLLLVSDIHPLVYVIPGKQTNPFLVLDVRQWLDIDFFRRPDAVLLIRAIETSRGRTRFDWFLGWFEEVDRAEGRDSRRF